MKQMGIDNFSADKDNLARLLDIMNDFEEALQYGEPNDDVINFINFEQFFAYHTFADIKENVDKISLPKKPFSKKQNNFTEKAISSLYSNMIRFCATNKVTGIPISKKFLWNLTAILSDTKCVHHSHITGNIYGYAHIFCNEKVREIILRYQLLLATCSNSTFFPVKRLKASVWKTKGIIIGGKNPRDINFAYISNQVQFIDTIKYFQQSLGALASSLTRSEKSAIYSECQKYLMTDDRLSRTFLELSITDRDWVLNYSSSRKGTIPYEMISDFDFLNISPDKDFFEFHRFYSNIKDTVRSEEEYENVKKLYKLMKMSNLGELNKIYNFQDIIILCELFEQRSDLLK